MKRFLSIAAVLLAFTCCILLALNIWIGKDVKSNIQLAELQYPGSAEDALIAFLHDSAQSPSDKTHIAVWTLGRINSEKALPELHKLYRNDPEGKSCSGHHDQQICQYEIHKAIRAIEKKQLFSHQRFNR